MHPCRFIVREESPLIDEPVSVRLTGAPPCERITLVATWADSAGAAFASSGEFISDAAGAVDPVRDASVGGTYTGVDPYGLWWSMAAGDGVDVSLAPVLDTRLDAYGGGTMLATCTLGRRLLVEGVRVHRERGDGLVADLYVPARGRGPGVIVVGGSGGGTHWSGETAGALASRGFTALALAYFGVEGLPSHLVEIPLEYFEDAAAWLLRHPATEGPRLGVVGKSRGGELALLLGSMIDGIGAVVAASPSAVAWKGYHPRLTAVGSSWTWRGSPIPYVTPDGDAVEAAGLMEPVELVGAFLSALSDGEEVARATIPVERTRGPILLVSGDDDRLWPSTLFARMIVERLTASGHPRPLHLRYPDAGHAAGGLPGLPAASTTGVHPVERRTYALGGTRAANAASGADAWPRILRFLAEHLSGGGDDDALREDRAGAVTE